jgi:DNA-binding transcriptional ArsR family regulator
MLGAPRRNIAILEEAAALAGTLAVGDYGEATLAIRELTSEAALDRLAARAAPGLAPDPALPMPQRLADLAARYKLAAYVGLGFELPAERSQWLVADVNRAVRILRDGDLHARFWQWLDRFYYECYRPWRQTRTALVRSLEAHAETALGGRAGRGAPPTTNWLPAQSPILRYPELSRAVAAGQLSVIFLAEPYGIVDLWELRPGQVVVSFARAGESVRDFQDWATSVANRLKALSDPTRLIILRMIRSFSMVNTEIAAYLGLAQPTVSVHAKVLREAGLIRSRQEGRIVRHELVAAEVRHLLADLEAFLDLPEEGPEESSRQ